MKIFRAIPSYYGGKQKLVKHIFKYIPAGARLLDGFMGAGSVSLFAKWRGHELISNDYSFLSRVIGEALINNSRARIQEHWITEAMKQEGEWPWEEEFTQRLQRVLLDKDITILAKLINYAYDQEGAKKWLMLLLAMKYFAYMLPFGGDITNLRTPKEYKKAEFTKWTETDAKQVRKFREDRIHRLKSIAEDINRAVAPAHRRAEFWNKDVFQAIQEAGEQGIDTAYLDPPYMGAMSYEKRNFYIEWLLLGKKPKEPEDSIFNSKEHGARALEKLAEACKEAGFKRVILSYWTKDITAKQLEEIFKEFNLKQVPLNYKYTYGTADRSKGALEFLGVGAI